MPDELWKDVQDIVQEKGTKNITKAKWLSGEALQIAVKRRDMKGKGEKERCTHLNEEFQRIARRDKKAFLRQPFCLFCISFLGDGLHHCLLYNVMNLRP